MEKDTTCRRAADHEGEVLESYVTKKRDKKAALKFMKKAMRRYGSPNQIVTGQASILQCSSKRAGLFRKASYRAVGKQQS
jgi:putative transposase